jgi:hypothetical protein
MTQFSDLFKPEALFSNENPLPKSVQKTHLLFAKSFDKAARLQLSFAEDLLDINRKRIDALYAGESFMDTVSAQQDIATEFGNRVAACAGDLKEVVVDFQSNVTGAANDLVSPAVAKTPAAKGKKAKAA